MASATSKAGGQASDKSYWALAKEIVTSFSEDRGMRLSAALAAYTILSLAPLIIILIKILSFDFILGPQRAAAIVQAQMQQLIGPAGAQAIAEMVESAAQPGSGILATIVSVCILLWGASYIFAEIQDSLNTIWEVKLKPTVSWWHTIKKRFLSISMVFVIAFLLLVSMFITAALGAVLGTVVGKDRQAIMRTDAQVAPAGPAGANVEGGGAGEAQGMGEEQKSGEEQKRGIVARVFGYLVDFVVTTVVVWLLFMMIFKFLPDAQIVWRDVWLGALVTAVLFKIGQYFLTAYFYFGSTTSAYGAFGSLVAVLLWAYYSSVILFLGAEFTQVYARRQGGRIAPDVDAVKVTEEERAQQGLPDRRRLVAKAEGRPVAARGAAPAGAVVSAGLPPIHMRVVGSPGASPAAGGQHNGRRLTRYLAAAGGVAVGALGGWYVADRVRRSPAEKVNLKERINAVDAKIGHLSQLRELVNDVNTYQRIKEVERQIRHTRTAIRANANERPQWLVRLGDRIAGNT